MQNLHVGFDDPASPRQGPRARNRSHAKKSFVDVQQITQKLKNILQPPPRFLGISITLTFSQASDSQ